MDNQISINMSLFLRLFMVAAISLFLSSCKKKIKMEQDEVYSQYLKEPIPLTIITTHHPDNKKDMNLLILNDGQDYQSLRIKETLDSLNKKKTDTAPTCCLCTRRRPDEGLWCSRLPGLAAKW